MASFGRLIDHWDEQLRLAFLESFNKVRSQVKINQIVRMLEEGNVQAAVDAVNLDPALFRRWDQTISNSFEAGGNEVMALIPEKVDANGLRATVQFDIRNPNAEDWLKTHSSRSITEITKDQRVAIREQLVDGMSKGLNSRASALELVGRVGASGRREGGIIGLTSSQAEWSRNYRDKLASDNPLAALDYKLRDKRFDAAVLRAAEAGEPVPKELRDKMVRTYNNRALRYRAETIARTEAMASLHQSQEEAIRQGISEGAIEGEAVTEIWRATKDDRTRDSHAAMDGQEVERGEPFITGNGVYLMYPGDPNGPPEEVINCRCWREIKVDFLRGVR